MSVEFSFLADGIYSIEQVESICLRLPDVTAEEIVTTISDSLQIINLEYKQLPVDFIELSEIRLQGITITGSSSADLDMVPVFSDVVNKVSSNIASFGSLDLSGYFEEKESSQKRDGCDRVYIRRTDGRYFFAYSPNGSKVSVNADYRLSVFKKIVKFIGLPIGIKESKGTFSLKHLDGAELNAGSGLMRTPSKFICEMPSASGDGLVNQMGRFLAKFSSGKIFWYEWSLSEYTSQLDEDISDVGKKLYDIAIKNHLPAEKYEVHLSFHIQGLTGLENARKWCTQKGSLYSTVCYFTSDEGAAGNFVVLGSQKGYEIKLSFNQPVDIAKIEGRLGVKFKEELEE